MDIVLQMGPTKQRILERRQLSKLLVETKKSDDRDNTNSNY